MDWTAHVFIHTTTEVYWGKQIFQIAPDLINSFLKWEETNWKYLFQLPRYFSEDLYGAKEQLIDFNQSQAERPGSIHSISASEVEMRNIDLRNDEIAKINMLSHWA